MENEKRTLDVTFGQLIYSLAMKISPAHRLPLGSLWAFIGLLTLYACTSASVSSLQPNNPAYTDPTVQTAAIAEAPPAVAAGFQQRYADFQPSRWSVSRNVYYADYTRDGQSYRAGFLEDGTWLLNETEVSSRALPLSVYEAYQQSRPEGRRNVRFIQVQTPEYEVLYRAEGAATNGYYTEYYTPDGRRVETPRRY